ncbi:MAG TPA: tyrosine-type recombinase/integrase [bacterium]|nr:tyrosine-type recombinase/integrase [bacterium]
MTKLKEVHAEFINKLKEDGKASSTIIAYNKDIEQLVESFTGLGVNSPEKAELQHLVQFVSGLSDIGLTPKTISRKINATKTFFKYLTEKGHIPADVSEGLKHPKIETKPPRILSKMEYRALRDTARKDVRTFTMIEVLLQTGISISEISLMKIDHINFDKQELYVPARESKGGRTIPLNSAVIEALKTYIEKHRKTIKADAPHVFITKTGNKILVRNTRSTIDRYFDLSGIIDARVNNLRHTFIAHHLSQGVSLQTVSKIVGHKRISTTEKYLDYIEKETEKEKAELGVL